MGAHEPPHFPCRLPPDTRGVASGCSYEPTLIAGRDNNKGTGWGRRSPKTGRRIQCLSTGERRLAYLLDVCPDVIDYREQYPWVSDELLACLAKNPHAEIPRNKLRTLDFVVTLPALNNTLRYTVISCKTYKDSLRPDVKRRLENEKHDCKQYGWNWILCTENNLNPESVRSAMRLVRWVTCIDIDNAHDLAFILARLVEQKNRGQSLDELLVEVGYHLGIKHDSAYGLFATAVCLGFLALKLDSRLDTWRPITINPARR